MGGRKKAKGRGRQNQSRNKSHNQVVKQPNKGQSSDQHSDTDSQANAVEKEDVSYESSNNDQYEDASTQAIGSQEVMNQHQLDVKDDDEPEEESCIEDTSNDCSIDQEDGGAGISYQVVSPQDVLKQLEPDENFTDDQQQNQIQKQGSESHNFDGQTTIRDTSNENSPLESIVEQQYNQNVTDDQLQEGSLLSLVSQNLFAQITVSSPYKRELEEYSPHRRDKRPIKLLRIEPDCKIHSNNQQESLQHEVMQEQQDDNCEDDQLPLDEQEYNSKLHIQEECQQLCSKGVQDDMGNQLITVKMHEVHHSGEDEFYNNVQDQRFSDQQNQQYDAKQDQEAEVKDDKEFESKQSEQVIANQEEQIHAKKNEKLDAMQNIQLNVNQEDLDATEQNEELSAQVIERHETKQNEHFEFKQYEQLATKLNEELVVKQNEEFNAQQIDQLEAKLNETLDSKQVQQLATRLNEESVAKQNEWHDKLNEEPAAKKNEQHDTKLNELVSEQNEWLEDKLNVEPDAKQNEKSIGRLYEVLDVKEHDTKLYEQHSGKQIDKHNSKINEELDTRQNEQLHVKQNDKSDIKVDREQLFPDQNEWLEKLKEEFDAKQNEKTIVELCEELNVKVKEEHDTKLYEQPNGKRIDKHDLKINDELDTRQSEKLDVKQNKKLDIKGNKEFDDKQKEELYAKKHEELDIRVDNAEQNEELDVRHNEELPVKMNTQLCIIQRKELNTKEIITLGVQQGLKVDAKQNDLLNSKQNKDHVKQIEQLIVKDIEPMDAKANDEAGAKQKEQHITRQNDQFDDRQSIHFHEKESEQCVTKHIDHFNAKVDKELDTKQKEEHYAKQSEGLDDQQNEQLGEKQNDKFDVNVEPDVKQSGEIDAKLIEQQNVEEIDDIQNEQLTPEQNEELDVREVKKLIGEENEQISVQLEPEFKQKEESDSKPIEKMNIEVNAAMQSELLTPEPNEELDDREDKQLISKENEKISVQQNEGLDVRQDEQLTDEQNELFSVHHNEKLEGKKNKQLDAQKIENFDAKMKDEFVTKQNKQVNVKHRIDVHLNGKLHSKGLQNTVVKVNYAKQNEHYTSRQNEEFIVSEAGQHHVKNDEHFSVKENEELDTEHVKKLVHKQVQDTDPKQCQEINVLDKQEEELDDKQNQELDDKQAEEHDSKQGQELEVRQDQELDAKHFPAVDTWQNQKVEPDHGKLFCSQQIDKIAFKESEECNIKPNKAFDIKQNEKYQNGKEVLQLYEEKQNEYCDIEEHVNQQQEYKQECEPEEKISQQEYVPNHFQNSMMKILESQNSSELNKNLKQEDTEFSEIADADEKHKYKEFHRSMMKSVKNCGHKQCDCSSQQADMLAFKQNELCDGKQSKAINIKQYEEHYESKEAHQLHAGKQNEYSSRDGLVTQQQESMQKCDFEEENHSQHDGRENHASQKNSLMDRQQKQNPELNELAFTNDHQGEDIQQSRMESVDNCQDKQYNKSQSYKPNDQQSEVKEINQHQTGTQESEQELQNNLSLDEHQFHASGQAEKVNKEIKLKESKQEEKQEVKQDGKGEKKSFCKHGNHQSVSKQDQIVRGNRSNHCVGKHQYYSWKGYQVGYNNHNNYYDSHGYQNTRNYQKGYQHEHQRKRDQNYHRGHRSWQNNQSHYQQQQIKPLGTSQSGGLVCGLCEDKYNCRTRIPRNLFCGHSVCTSCAQKLLRYNVIHCPYCKVRTLRVQSAEKLPVNLPLMAFLPDEATAKPIVTVSNKEETGNQPHSTEVGATGGQQYHSSLKHTEKSIVTVRNTELMGSQQYCDLNYSTGESHSPTLERSPHSSRCLEVGVHPTAHCAGCEQWVCDICGRIDHHEKKGCALIPLKETLIQMKQEKENNLKAIGESLSRSLKETRDYSDHLDVLLLSMGAAFECLGKEQQCIRKTLQEGLEMRKNLEVLVSKLPQVNNLPEVLLYFQAVENDCAATQHWISDRSSRAINNDKVKTAGKELISITLQSLMTSTAENGLVSQIVACQETPSGKKFSQLTVDGGRMHLHSLSGITRLKEAQTLPLECFKACLDSTSTLAYLDLFWDGSFQGRVYIRLTGNTVRGRQFLSLCTGEKGPTLRNTHFHRVWWKGLAGEHVWGGDYDQGDGSGDVALTSICDSEDAKDEVDCAVPITPGLVAGRYEKKNVSSIFRIYTREAKHSMEEAAFGRVEGGLPVVEKAISHNNIQDVIISDCGIVMEV